MEPLPDVAATVAIWERYGMEPAAGVLLRTFDAGPPIACAVGALLIDAGGGVMYVRDVEMDKLAEKYGVATISGIETGFDWYYRNLGDSTAPFIDEDNGQEFAIGVAFGKAVALALREQQYAITRSTTATA